MDLITNILMLLIAVVPIPSLEEASEPPAKYYGVLDVFSPREFTSEGSAPEALAKVPYRLYRPVGSETPSSAGYPLILWLHGAGESGSDNLKQLRYLDKIYAEAKKQGVTSFVMLVPQKPGGGPWFKQRGGPGATDGEEPDMLDIVSALLDETIASEGIDPDRVVVMGLSSGGSAAWELALRYPTKFAALVPCACYAPSSGLELLTALPVWALHSPTDVIAAPGPAVEGIERLRSLGGNAEISLLSDYPDTTDKLLTHHCWLTAVRDYRLLQWMTQQSRSAVGPPPGVSADNTPLQWKTRLPAIRAAGVALVALLIARACFADFRRRSSAGDATTPENTDRSDEPEQV